MPFTITLHFLSVHDRDLFEERVVPHLRARVVDPPADESAEAQGYERLALAVTSPSAARDVVRRAGGFVSHLRGGRIVFAWENAEGERQFGEIVSGEARDADLLSMRVGAASKALLDAEKASIEHGKEEDSPASAAEASPEPDA